jgi:chemotaxis protein methyltransferase CheR
MPHLHAGLLAKRAGDALVARRELGQALMLLEREDTSRVVLFGGGFSREALTALCRAELEKLGDAS